MSGRSRVDTTSAEDKSIGFDYQYYYFLNELLNLKNGQVVGLEVLDDVHVERPDGTNLLVQLKHTVQTNTQGLPINLTTLDGDLWKSISNWCKLIIDPADGRASVASQLSFLETTSFLLASNKAENGKNALLISIDAFKAATKTHAELVTDITSLKAKTKDLTIQGYIDDVLSLDNAVSERFFQQLSFALGKDEIIDLCKASIAEKHIHPSRIDDVFHAVDSEVRQNSYATVKAGRKITFSFDEFTHNYRRHFDKARSGTLPFRKLPPVLPDDILGQTFIKQLVDIDDVKLDDIEFHTSFTTRRLHFRDNLERLVQDGDITQSDIDDLEEEAAIIWEGRFRQAYSGEQTSGDECASARDIVGDLRQRKLTLAEQELPLNMSNGGFYDLSDRPVIGWLSNWKDRYK
ncbi:hypothetical protein [Sinorhizobium medicae]|uniref:hypothetical protein n=1 Tax=Sinorhizobium medicae TaxID=110321 RepID=UPI000FDA841C|nr:hypothetical protein [Sinorhizobium medicae]MDX0439145.1 hypothetical protein [Sinorhizobium medicae]MDX0617564.1 hypothetical protein [Sinorhizobium medicae]MDX0654709.1 hypothetical protein [Sinorhizobium medicae]MDX1090917.1 hypothetical protein [Sinorhizobium medicae]MDX1115556.1 hypothetical protein [Sinorhizobium medicae]